MTEVQPMMCGTCSNENAMKTAFIAYMVSILVSINVYVATHTRQMLTCRTGSVVNYH